MGMMASLSAEIETSDLCGSCKRYRGSFYSGNLSGICLLDDELTKVNKPHCLFYGRKENAN
jgi:hypothetical protein